MDEQTNVERPRGRPPWVIWSSPSIPVGHLESPFCNVVDSDVSMIVWMTCERQLLLIEEQRTVTSLRCMLRTAGCVVQSLDDAPNGKLASGEPGGSYGRG